MEEHLCFTLEFEQSRISVLDVLIMKIEQTLQTDLYHKPTDRNILLHGDSFHPTCLISCLPICQFHLVQRVCHSDINYNTQAADLKNIFFLIIFLWAYKHEWVEAASKRFNSITQEQALTGQKAKSPFL